ncbi:MAG: nascent polypeptide-associated complex protein [Candidatus Micrarchaeota archaeon]
MFPKIDPRQMAGLMRQMGIKSTEIKAHRVVIETLTGGKIVIDSPKVLEMDMQGEKNFQISGTVRELESKIDKEDQIEIAPEQDQEPEKLAEQDIGMVAEQAKISREHARKLLEESSGDIAQAIMKSQGAQYLGERKGSEELLKMLEATKSHDLKEKLPLLFGGNESDMLKAVVYLHGSGKEYAHKMVKGEGDAVRKGISEQLKSIIAKSANGKTLVLQELNKKATELNSWLEG